MIKKYEEDYGVKNYNKRYIDNNYINDNKDNYDNKNKGEEVLKKFRNKMAARGTRGIMSIRRAFMIADDDNSKRLDFNEFKKFCHDYRIGLNDDEIKELFNQFDRDGSGHIDYEEFVYSTEGQMNDFRKNIVKKVFDKLDKNKNGALELDDIRDTYNAKKHPDVVNGKKSEDEVLAEFLDTLYEGNLIRVIRRVEEFVKSFETSVEHIGDYNLKKKLGEMHDKIKRDLPFASSLYLE